MGDLRASDVSAHRFSIKREFVTGTNEGWMPLAADLPQGD